MLRDSGLAVVEASYSLPGPVPMDAWRVVISGDAVPTVRVPHDSVAGNNVGEIERSWVSTAAEFGIFGPGGDFLLSVGAGQLGSLPWAHVRRGQDSSLARHLADHPGEPEFVAMSMDGRAICGVTTEEYDVWIIGANLG